MAAARSLPVEPPPGSPGCADSRRPSATRSSKCWATSAVPEGSRCRSRPWSRASGVGADDAAFDRPTRPVGPPYSAALARRLGRERGWTFTGSAARGHRRVVAARGPRCLVDADVLRRLLVAGGLVAAGVGRVPVIATPAGYRGVEAILQADAAAALLATALAADRLVFLTGVDRVEVGHRTPRAIEVERLSVAGGPGPPGGARVSHRIDGPEDRGGDRLRPGGRPRGDHHLAARPRRGAGQPSRDPDRALTRIPPAVTTPARP